MHIFYLIDTENVGKRWLDFIDPEENATIYLFCNANIKFSLTEVQTILFVSPKIHIIQCIPGKNSMDFFIIMKLGELLSLHKKAQFYIVSGDHDFDGLTYSHSSRNGILPLHCEIVLQRNRWLTQSYVPPQWTMPCPHEIY